MIDYFLEFFPLLCTRTRIPFPYLSIHNQCEDEDDVDEMMTLACFPGFGLGGREHHCWKFFASAFFLGVCLIACLFVYVLVFFF